MYPKFPRSLEPKKGVAEKSVFTTFSNFNTKLHRSVTIKLTKILRDILWTAHTAYGSCAAYSSIMHPYGCGRQISGGGGVVGSMRILADEDKKLAKACRRLLWMAPKESSIKDACKSWVKKKRTHADQAKVDVHIWFKV